MNDTTSHDDGLRPPRIHLMDLMPETARWHARDVRYLAGTIEQVMAELPEFELRPFKHDLDGPPNPFLRTVVRLPRNEIERAIPVGVVSNSYSLASHRAVVAKCIEGMRDVNVDTRGLRAELGLSQLGEWMNFRIYFPDSFKRCPSDKHDIALRMECFNSVDGSCRLVVLLGWIRFICSNGMIVGESKAELRDIHDARLDLEAIRTAIVNGLRLVEMDLGRLRGWEATRITFNSTRTWVDNHLSDAWGKRAASRVFHICTMGKDTELADSFAPGPASEKPVREIRDVPGAIVPADNLYAVGQALSWVATGRTAPEQRVNWQYQIADLLNQLRVTQLPL